MANIRNVEREGRRFGRTLLGTALVDVGVEASSSVPSHWRSKEPWYMIAVCGGSGAASLLPCASPSFFPNYKMICFKFFSPLKFPHQISESQFKISLGLMFLKRLFEHYLKYFSHFQLSNLFRNSKFKTIFLIYLLKKYCILVKIISLK